MLDALQKNLIKEINNISDIKPETKFGKKTRFDLVLKNTEKIFVEVKNVTLSKRKIAEFRCCYNKDLNI